MDDQKPLVDLDGAESIEELRGLTRYRPGMAEGELRAALWGVELTGWHATRLLDAREVTGNGLWALDAEENLRRIALALDAVELTPEQNEVALEDARHYLGRDRNRSGIHFFSMERDVISRDHYKYAWTYGGETLKWAVQKAIGEEGAYKALAIGEPWLVKLRYPFSGLSQDSQDAMIGRLLACLNGEDDGLQFHGWLLDSVPAEAVLEVKPLEIPWYPE